jgi:hypothetical protein
LAVVQPATAASVAAAAVISADTGFGCLLLTLLFTDTLSLKKPNF